MKGDGLAATCAEQYMQKFFNCIIFVCAQAGKDEGATLLTGGKRPAHLAKGYFLEPTVFTDVKPDMRICCEEIFGPVLSVLTFKCAPLQLVVEAACA